ncbi:hypothetical protein TGARI_243615 [Toxoplasma gondii ARI]|uniref:Uncharacterized protein n=1 Tax=Toxoplasma gondii ARI TaxID=1074872 RepID=A0A139XQI4_TOXGO|nr:hypothetical protein TGARI_243615 [Toxoplasma gondii ARI]
MRLEIELVRTRVATRPSGQEPAQNHKTKDIQKTIDSSRVVDSEQRQSSSKWHKSPHDLSVPVVGLVQCELQKARQNGILVYLSHNCGHAHRVLQSFLLVTQPRLERSPDALKRIRVFPQCSLPVT